MTETQPEIPDAKHIGEFRMRGREMTRIETFTDAAFAFAVTLLAVSTSLDKTEKGWQVGDLWTTLNEVPVFAATLAVLMTFWYGHHTFSRRYGLEDAKTITLSIAFLFVLLVYVFPLKFLLLVFMEIILGIFTGASPAERMAARGFTENSEMSKLFAIYAIGYVAASAIIALMFAHAHKKRDELGLNEIELFDTRTSIREWTTFGSVGLLSLIVALVSNDKLGLAGWAYMLLPIIMPWFGIRHDKQRKALVASLEARAKPTRD